MERVLLCLMVCVAATMARTYRRETGPCHQHLQQVYENGVMPGTFIPHCEDDGTYSAVQCRGSVCECRSAEGEIIPEYAGHRVDFQQMDCKCARAAHEVRGMLGGMPNCDPLGNYAAIQCRGTECFCANRDGERLYDVDGVPRWEQHKLEGEC